MTIHDYQKAVEVCEKGCSVHDLEPGREASDDFPDAFHHEDAVLVAQAAVAYTLVEELDQGGAHIVVVTPVNNLDCQHVKSSDQLCSFWHVGHRRLQEDEDDNVHEIVEDLHAGLSHDLPVAVHGHQHHGQILQLSHDLLAVGVVYTHLSLQRRRFDMKFCNIVYIV